MSYLIFFIAAIGTLAGAIGVITLKDPFYSVLALVVHLISLAVLFMLLHAEFVAAAQVVVYAGAVMVLYVFVVQYVGDETLQLGIGSSLRGEIAEATDVQHRPSPRAVSTTLLVVSAVPKSLRLVQERMRMLTTRSAVARADLARVRRGDLLIDFARPCRVIDAEWIFFHRRFRLKSHSDARNPGGRSACNSARTEWSPLRCAARCSERKTAAISRSMPGRILRI